MTKDKAKQLRAIRMASNRLKSRYLSDAERGMYESWLANLRAENLPHEAATIRSEIRHSPVKPIS